MIGWRKTVWYSVAMLAAAVALPVCAAEGTTGSGAAGTDLSAWMPLIVAEALWLLLVALVMPAYAAFSKSEDKERRGLNLPRGSVRSILALLIVGSFVNVLVFGPIASNNLETVITAFGTLAGSVVGFYFGSRTAA